VDLQTGFICVHLWFSFFQNMKITKRFAAAALLAFALTAGAARADSVPGLVNYQGVLRDSLGRDFAMGAYTAEFRLWTAPQGGTAVWGKAYAFNVITSGQFNVILGDVGTELSPAITHALAQAIINNPNQLYLAIVVVQTPGGTVASPHELAPRQHWVSAPYALKSSVADSTLAVGGNSSFFDIGGLDKAQVPAGGMRMLGLSNNVVVYLAATSVSNNWVVETNLTIGGAGTVNIVGGLKTDVLRGPTGGTLPLMGNVRMFASQWTMVPFGAAQTPTNCDGWVMVQLPDMSQLPASGDYTIWITVHGTSTPLLFCQGALQGSERCLTYPLPANCSWRVYSNTAYPASSPVGVYFLGLNRSL
jgi:hypothetical protein